MRRNDIDNSTISTALWGAFALVQSRRTHGVLPDIVRLFDEAFDMAGFEIVRKAESVPSSEKSPTGRIIEVTYLQPDGSRETIQHVEHLLGGDLSYDPPGRGGHIGAAHVRYSSTRVLSDWEFTAAVQRLIAQSPASKGSAVLPTGRTFEATYRKPDGSTETVRHAEYLNVDAAVAARLAEFAAEIRRILLAGVKLA